jgi:hypothetical protein
VRCCEFGFWSEEPANRMIPRIGTFKSIRGSLIFTQPVQRSQLHVQRSHEQQVTRPDHLALLVRRCRVLAFFHPSDPSHLGIRGHLRMYRHSCFTHPLTARRTSSPARPAPSRNPSPTTAAASGSSAATWLCGRHRAYATRRAACPWQRGCRPRLQIEEDGWVVITKASAASGKRRIRRHGRSTSQRLECHRCRAEDIR